MAMSLHFFLAKLAAEKQQRGMNTNEAAARNAYQLAEREDLAGRVNCFTEDGTFTNESIGVTYRGKELSRPVEIYAAAFPDMHRELYRFFVEGDTVIVELALQGTQKEPLELPLGTIQPTGKRMDAPCCDVFRLKKRQDSILRLLSVRHGDLDAIARSSNIEMSSSSLHFTREERIER